MPLAAVAMDLPADVAAVYAGDLDGDGRAELVFASQRAQRGRPDTVTLSVVAVSDAGQASLRQSIPLGDTPMLWDIHNGLWGVDADGARNLLTGERVVSAQTMLALLGPTTPRSADIADDLDNNGIVELMLPSRGALRVFTTDGEAVGSLAATSTGELSTRDHSGGTMIVASSMVPSTVIGDLDGDGLRDVLMPDGTRAVGWRTTDEAGGEKRSMRLPLDLDPDEGPDRPDVRLAQSWFVDLDGDGKLDLATHHWVTSGTWFGSTARLTAYTGTGAGWQPLQTMNTTRAAFEVQMLDFDSDGDQDIFVAEVDIGLGNIGRALLARTVQVELGVYAMEGGRYPATPKPIRTLSWPIESPETMLLSMDGDLDGDGWLDLVTNDAGSQLHVYRGSASGLATTPTASLTIGDARRGDRLLVRDLTGDGRAEVLLWRADDPRAKIIQLRQPRTKTLSAGLIIRRTLSVSYGQTAGVDAMGLIQEAARMIAAGIGLVAQEFLTWEDGESMSSLRNTVLRRVVHSRGDVFYEVIDYRRQLNGELHRYRDPAEAAHSFARLVGRSALSRAVAAHRYAFLFPRGSSLDWNRSRKTRRRIHAA